MKLIILYSPLNMVVRLINADACNTESSSERDLDTWMVLKGKNLRYTWWNNRMQTPLNPYKYNRINIHYNDENGKIITKSYYYD